MNSTLDAWLGLTKASNYWKGLDGWKFDDPPIFPLFDFEANADVESFINFAQKNWRTPFYAGALYLFVIYYLQKFMKDRPPYKLRFALFLWNGALGVFSFIAFIRVIPAFLKLLFSEDGFYKSLCTREGAEINSGFWLIVFAYSKYIELGDTVFLILRKKEVVLLQWFHHLTSLIVIWLVSPLVEPISRWWAIMNYGVHSLMYPYFALRAIHVHIPSKLSNLITTLQLLQMIMGLYGNIYTIRIINQGVECSRHPLSIKVMTFVYGTFCLLFGKLFYDSIIGGKKKRARVEAKKPKQKDL